jgi:hypothetical protein
MKERHVYQERIGEDLDSWLLYIPVANNPTGTVLGLTRPLNVQELHVVDALVQLGSIQAALTYIEDALRVKGGARDDAR